MTRPRTCRVCRCTHSRPCATGCGWAGADLCTICADILDAIVRRARAMPAQSGELLGAVAAQLEHDGVEPEDLEGRRMRKALADLLAAGELVRDAARVYRAKPEARRAAS